MSYYPEFSALLDEYLAAADRSGAWLAQRLGLNPATVTRWRNGDTRPNSPEMVNRLVDVLGVREATALQHFLQAAGYGYGGAMPSGTHPVQPEAPPSPPRPVTDWLLLPQPADRAAAYWQQFPLCYRAQEMQTFAHWITACVSGAVLGLPGMGKSNLLNFLCQRPDALRRYLPTERLAVVLIPVDLSNLLETTLSALHRLFVRAFYERREHFAPILQPMITEAYQTVSANRDAFVSQSVLRDLLFAFTRCATRVVLVLDRFDGAYSAWTPEMGDTLRSLRDGARDTLTYIVGGGRALADLDKLTFSPDLYRLLATHYCYVGPLSAADARAVITCRLALHRVLATEEEIDHMLALTGGCPTLLKLVCHWWLMLAQKPPVDQWLPLLSAETTVQKCLADLWGALSLAEQQGLWSIYKATTSAAPVVTKFAQDAALIMTLLDKGLCVREGANLRIFSLLFAHYIGEDGA
ncbi:MAG: hypothetical protein U0350_35725 [Caldilineaceae bacterium]